MPTSSFSGSLNNTSILLMSLKIVYLIIEIDCDSNLETFLFYLYFTSFLVSSPYYLGIPFTFILFKQSKE